MSMRETRWMITVAMALAVMAPYAAAQEEVAQVPQSTRPAQTPQGPGPAMGPGHAPVAASPSSPMGPGAVPVGVVPAIAVGGTPASVPTPTNLGGEVSTLGPYTLGPDDVVFIDVRNQPDFSGSFVVGQDGMIQYGIIGDIKADGLTKEELAEVVADWVKQYVRFPSVHVTITGFNSKAIYIVGRVASPGKYAMRGDTIKVRDALVAAGLEAEYAALSRVRVIKTDPSAPKVKKVNLQRVLYKGQTADDIDLVNGDVVMVPTSLWGYVSLFFKALFGPVTRVAKWVAL